VHTIKLNIQDSAFEKVIYFLNNLPKNDIEIIEEKTIQDDWSHLESEIDKGLNSGVSENTHEDIVSNIKNKYVQN
jgi:hypothetical protein